MNMGLPTRRHGHVCGDTTLVFDIDHLMIDHIVVRLINTFPIWTRLHRLGDSFDIQRIGIYSQFRPLTQSAIDDPSAFCATYMSVPICRGKWVNVGLFRAPSTFKLVCAI